jgi:hypothetical protein
MPGSIYESLILIDGLVAEFVMIVDYLPIVIYVTCEWT